MRIARLAAPFGRRQQVAVDLGLEALYARDLKPGEGRTAISNAGYLIPAGITKMSAAEYVVKLQTAPT
jgi:hypothetical protein